MINFFNRSIRQVFYYFIKKKRQETRFLRGVADVQNKMNLEPLDFLGDRPSAPIG